MKHLIAKAALIATSLTLFSSKIVHADEISIERSPEHITIVTTDENGHKVTTGIDASQAIAFDELGRFVGRPNLTLYSPEVIETKEGLQISLEKEEMMHTSGISGGTWQNGSGYQTVKGLKIYHYNRADVSFNADLEYVKGGADRLNRIYNVNIYTSPGSNLQNIVRQGVFKRIEQNGPAYGGVQYILTNAKGGSSSVNAVYLKVANDRSYIDIRE